MLKKIIDFYRALPPAERPVSLTDEEAVKLTKKLRLQSFFAGQLEQLRDSCTNKRDLAIIDILSSTGIRVGELVKLNREDIFL